MGFVTSLEDAWPVSTPEYVSKSKWPYHKTRVHTVCITLHHIPSLCSEPILFATTVISLFGPPCSSEATCFEANAVVMIATHALPLLHKRSSAPTCFFSIQTESATILLVVDSLLRKTDGYGSNYIICIHLSKAVTKKCVHLDITQTHQPERFHSRVERFPSTRDWNLWKDSMQLFLETKSKWCEFEVVPWSTQLDLEIVGQARRFVKTLK